MRFQIVTLFPEFFDSPLSCALLAKGREAGLVDVALTNPRDFAEDRHKSVDDRPYGGGPGMVMMPGPLEKALASLPEPGRMLVLSPGGRPLDQGLARELAAEPTLTLVCGRYEGIDARVAERFPLEAVSIGDFVLSGGEAAALCLIEAVARLTPGFMGKEASAEEESFSAGLLEYPHYTRPPAHEGLAVPDILLSGHHADIAAWRREKSLETTLAVRPDLLARTALSARDLAFLSGLPRRRPGRNLHLALLHGPVCDKFGRSVTVSLTNLDIHDIARVSRSYGLGGYAIVTPLADQRLLAARLLAHWTEGPGGRGNPDRAEALRTVSVHESLALAVADVAERRGRPPLVVATSARGPGGLTFEGLRRRLEKEPVLLVLGTGSGLGPEILDAVEAVLPPLRPFDGYNHLSVRSAAAVMVDRILGDVY